MFDEQDRQYFYNEFKSNGYEVGSYDDFEKDLNNKEDRDWYYNEAKNMGYDVGTQADFDKMVLEPAASASPSTGGKQVVASAHASTETKPQVAQPVAKPKTEYPQEVLDAYNSPDNKPGNFKDLAQLNDEYQRGVLNKPGIISQALGMIPKVDAGNIGREQKMGGMIANMLLGDNMQQPQQTQQPQDNNQQVQQPAQQEASPESKEEVPVTAPTSVVNNEGLLDAKLANYLENWKQRPDKKGTYFENMVADLLADGTANSNEEAVKMVQSALGRYANRSAMDVTNQVVASLPDDTVQDAEKSIEAQWYSHGVQDKLKQEADSMGISYDDYVAQFLKPAMVQSLVNKYGPNYRDIAEGIATRLYSHDEHVQDRLMNQDINEALSDVISKYVSPSVVDEYNKAQEAGSKAFTEGMEGSQFIPANLRLGTALGAQYEANEAKDPAKVLSGLQKKFGKLYRNPEFLNDMSNAAFKVMQRYGLNDTQSSDPKQFKPMINSVLKNELDQLEIKGMMPKGSAEYIMKTGLGNTIVGKITRKAIQTDYQNWLEDIANQQYQPGFWENVASGALTFAGDAWSYWLPGAAGGKLTKSMIAKAEGKLAGDLMAKGMERKVAERAAKVLIGKSKDVALKNGAVHGAVTFGGQSAISKPIDEVYRTGQFDENGKIYNPSVGKIIANTLGEVTKQTAVGAIMQGGTIANMIGKGRGLATNILADVGGKVVDSGIMTGHQMLERMAQDPNFKPTGKDAAESFLESMANLTAIGLPGMVGKYARFKDAREFNKKFDFTDQDIAELKRFGYDDLRDAFEKLGINGYRADGEGVQMMGQLTDKYMNLMNDKGVPEVLKAKMMAVVEGKRPSSFSPVIDSIIVQPMDNDGKVYLETLNKDGGIIDRKGYSSLEEAQKAEKKLDFEKSLNITSEYEKAYHTDALQDRLNTVYEQARDKYAAGEQLSDEDKAAIYLHQNASAIGDIMQKQQSGMELTEQEQQMVNSYRHFYDSAFENSPIMKEYVRTFEDSQGVEHGTLRKALEGDGKSRTAEQQKLVEEYQKQLYNDIVLKREMNDAKEQMSQTLIEGQRELPGATQEGGASAQNAEATAEKPLDASVSSDVPPTEPPTPPVGGETPINAEGTPSVENGSSPSDATTASNESKSDAYIMGQNAYQKGNAEGLKAIDHNDDVSKARLKRAFGGDEAQMNVVVKAYEDGKDMEQFVAQRANSLTPAQQDAVHKYVEAQDAKNGVYDALQHADDGYGEALKEQLWPYQTEDGNIVPATLTTGQQVFLKKANEYGGGFVVVPDEQGQPTIKQVSSADIKEVGTPVPMDDYINQQFAEQVDARYKQFRSQFDGSGFKRGDIVSVSMEVGDEPSDVKIVGYTEDGRVILTDTDVDVNSQIAPNKLEVVTKDEFNAWRQNALDASIGAELDAEDAQRANDDAAKAEADKKQRYANGIVGLSEGQPDYSSKDTEPKVAAEYLQEQYGEDHGKLLNLVNGSRDDIKTQLANKKKAAAEYQNWLDTNADLDPEKAKKVEDELSLVNEQIADLDARFKNWNTIRNSVMTPEEVKSMKEERKAEVEKAGVDETAIVPSDDFHVLVLDDKELKKQYPTMNEASDYITSQRNDIYHTQEDVEHKINDVNGMLEQYINGETELDPTQLMELNTTKAQLEALQTNLSVAAKGLKAQANKLSKLYKTEVSQQEMEELGMTSSEQRKALVADALKKNDLGAIKEIYKDSSVDVTDLTPQTLEEAVSESLRPHSLNPESLQEELGKSNFKFGIGKGYDSNKFNYLIAKKGTGMSVNDFAVKVYNDLPVNLQDMGYTDQDVRNALLDMFKSYDSVKEMKNVALMNRIAAAEDELSSEEEYYEAQKEREIIERQAEIENYKSYIHEKELSLPSESELDHIYGLEYDRMMEIEDREREYKQYVKSILPELADYDDRSNEEGYGGGSSLGSDSSRRGVDEGNSQGEEVGNGEASSESEIGEGSDSGRKGRQETGSMEPGEGSAVRGSHLPQEASFGERLKSAIAETETEPTEAQKKAGNYKKGHLSFGGYDYTVETPKGVTRSGKDEQGKPWSVTMHDTYGYILGKIGVDGDHIDMFINDAADLDTFDGNVYVVDQVNPETGEFDEHKVMYGYPSEEAATEAYLANYSKDWKGLGKVTAVPKATFDKWLESSDRKTKPFADYAMIKKGAHQNFISDMEYTYENDVHPSEEDKPKMQKFAERLLDFHQDREDKPEYGYTMLSSNINGDKLYPSEKKWFGTKKYRQGVSWVDKDNVCAYELNPRFNARGYLTAVGVHKLVPLASFHRDVKEVKPSEMTEAQKVAYDAVSTMLKKAGIPVKVVSNEDMEKVAEAQDNLNLAMLLNQPEMRFKIKTPEEKQAAENAYNFAKELRPDKWKQYAVVDMSNPNKMPEYFEKQELARKERSYYNKLMWGNYKVFNLDKSFEDNVAGLTGSFPSEFDPYKIDAQTSKKDELKKQIKETEEAYKLTGQERKEYQNQLMKEYMDEHGLASENDIPDDVWREFDYKAVEKYQDKLDSLFAKYKDLDRQLKAVAEPGVQYLKGKGVVYGYTDGKEIVLNQEHLNANTPIHEYQHLWRSAAKKMNPELIEHGDKLIMQTQLFADLKEDPNYKHLSDDEICDEAFARLTGEDGAAILEQMAKDAIKENPLDTAKELTIINRLKDWLKKFWYWALDTFTKWKPEDIKKMTLEDIRNLVLRDLAQGVDPRTVLNEKKAKNAEDADKTLVGVHNISEDKLLKAIKQGGLANPSVAVIDSSKQDHKAYGGISLILPSDKVAKRTGKNAGTWQGDAYTPTYPQVERHISNKGSEQVNKDVLSVPKEIQHEVRNGIYRWLDGNTNSGLKYLFLHEMGNAPKMVELQHKYSDKVYNDLKSITSGDFDISSIGKADAQKVLDMYIDNVFDGDRTAYDEKQKYRIARYKKQVAEGEKNPFLLTRAKNALEQYDKYGFYFDKVQNFVRNVERDHLMTGVNMDGTLNEVEDYIKTNNLTDEFNTWLEGKEKEYGIKEVIFDGFTPSGNRRYVPNTLENVSKIMKKQGRNGATGAAVSFQNFAARLMPSYGTLKDIRSKKGLLTSDREKFDKFREKWSNVFFELGMKCQPDATGTFDDYGLARLSEAAMTRDPQAYLKKEYNVDFSDEDTKRLKEMVKAIKEEHPAMYFETKFERPVGFDEFSAAVVPTTTKKEVKEALKNAGVSIFEYDEKSDADRKRAFNEAINSNHEIRFHRVTEPEELERLNKEKTFRMYSGMQEVDGKLYSPMAAIIDGKRTDATEIGAWMGADERPDLVKGGKFQLVKTDKNPGAGEGPVRAAYNPYMHTSTSMMNDQFTGAYARGNIKVVEWEIPESEKTSGYHAEGAKDAVGLVPWHSGSVNGLLPKDRQRSVMLSRWRKAVRVVPDSEVAESIAKQLDGTGLAIPWNVVTPNQLRELVKLGVPITTEESGQQAPETKEKFLAQMEELKKEFPQAQFVDVKMTKDAFKVWGKKANVKSRLVESFEKEKARIVSEAKEKGSYMLAPNGKKSKLDAEQWATVRTANFKKWFGDWENDPENASKVVDENGEPMVVYHGRSADFNTFEKKEGVRFIMGLEDKVKAEGFFFSPDRALAEEFAGNAARHRGGKANVVPCYLNIRKPMDLTGEDYDRIYEDVTGWDYTVGMDTQDNLWGIMDEEGMADKIKEKGYDGAIFVEEVDDNYEPTKISYCALDANQIKSAGKNNGEFSSRNNDIRFRFGEPYDYEKYPLGRVEPNLATKEVKIVHADANHGFKDYKEAKNWAIGNICRTYSSDETGNKGEVIINKDVVSKYVSKAARDQSDNDDVHYAVLKVLPDVIREGIEAETHPNFNKVGNARKPEFGYDNHLLIHRVYGAVDIDGVVYRVKITMKENMQDRSLPNKPYSYEVTDISTKIEPLEAIDAQVQDHGSHSNDSISGTNLLKKVEMSYDKGKKLLDESEKMGISIENQRKIADSVVNTANKLGGAEATVYSSLYDVPEEYRQEVEQGAKGWYDPENHTVHVYLPNCEDGNDAQRTVFHEKIGHEGMEVLLGGENEVRKFANFVYRSAGKDVRGKIIDFANKYDPDWKNNDRINVGTQEYIAHLAEEGPKTAEDFSLWTKIKHYLIKVLKKLGVRVPGLLNDKDLRYYLMKAGKALHVWDEMPQEKQEAMMKQASNAEIKDALSDGTGKGKPRQKKGESAIQYMKRVMEWKRWKEAREDENDPEPPMFYDFDKDADGKKEWERLNKEWRDSHHLQGDEMPIKPERKEGETDEAFFSRYKEWEKWNDADLDLYEGKIYPAETNPEADALEQRVMQDLAEVTSTDVSKEGAAKTVKHAVIHRRKNMEEASADDAIYINDVKNRIEKMADSGAFDKLLSDYKGKPNRAEKLAEAIPYIIEAPRRLRDLAHDLNATGAFDKGHIHIQPADVEAIQPYVADLIAETGKKHTELRDGKEVEVYDDPQAVSEVASKMAQVINDNHQGEEGFVPIDGTDILSEHVLPLVKQQIVPEGIDYKNLSPEMKATLDSIRDWYNYTYDWLKDNRTLREDTGYNADYVNHIWDKEKSDKQAYAMYVENRQRTKSPNEKPRTISTLMEGISVGLVPKTTDITKMMAYYSRSNIEAWVNKTMLQELSGLNVIERNEDGEIVSSDPLLSSTPPFNLEQYQYFEIPGVGPVWVYNVSPKQVKVKNPITGKERVLYSEASAGDRFGVVFETYQSSPFWKAFDTLASSAKKLELGFSGFHAGALTEVYMVQNMVEFGPKKAMANFMKYIFVDTAKNHELPCFANPQDFQEAATHLVKFGATNDYAAADVQNMFDNMRDAIMKVQEKLKDGNKISGTVALASMPLKVATQMLSLINKGMDRALWDFLHDGLKLATYRMRADKTKERAKKKGWTEEELSRALDEDGQFVNDMFGGQHWDILGASHRTLRYAGRVLLSPDWNASTTRHFLALTGFGSIWNEATFENFKHYYKRLGHGILTPEDEGRRSRQISSLLCYGIGFMVFYEAIANGINAAFRAMDEEKERKKAEEIRKTNPSYRSPYELAYPDGMKWYDYLMRGNSLGQQSKIYLGRYADGTEMYIRHGKQFREVPEYLFNHKGELEFPGPMVQRMIGKANPMVRMTLDNINYLSDFQASHADQEIQRKYGKTIGLLYKDALYWAPFLIPSQENKEFKAVDFFFPSSKGFSPWKAQSYFKDFILSGDMEGVVMTYQSCQLNGIDPEAQIKAAIGSVKALESAEMQDGVTSLQEASKRFDAAKSITEKKKMRQKMKKFLSQSEYKAFTQKEALDMVQGYLNGDEDLKEMEKAESKYLMKAKAEDVTEDWRIQNVWNGTMETYQEYQRLKDIDKAKANAFKNSKTNKRLFAARKAISAAKKKMNKAKKQMDGQNDAAKLVEIRKTRKELLETLNGME